jgi:hypothetical protein
MSFDRYLKFPTLGLCYVLNICVIPKFIFWTHYVGNKVLAFVKYLGYEGWALVNGICVLIKETWAILFVFLSREDSEKVTT